MVLYTDNNQVLIALNTNRSRNRVVMGWLREIFWSSFVNNFHIVAKRISSKDNILPDCLSRFSNASARRLGCKLLTQGHYRFRNMESTF